nr:TetR/AcrR family transcriptional regulator [Deltaproteobacteria bacterium]
MRKRDGTTKDRILDAAEEIFSSRGFDGTKVQEIATAAGVNKAMLYYYFKDKDDLLISVIGRIIQGIGEAIPQYFADSEDTVENIEAFLDFYIGYLARNQSFVRIMAWEMLSGRHIQTIGKDYIIPVFSLMREKIVEAVDRKTVRPVSPEHTVFSVVGMNVFYIVASPMFMLILGDDPLSEDMMEQRKKAVKDL